MIMQNKRDPHEEWIGIKATTMALQCIIGKLPCWNDLDEDGDTSRVFVDVRVWVIDGFRLKPGKED